MSELKELESKSVELIEQAKSYKVSNQKTYEESAAYLSSVRILKSKIEAFFEPTIEKFKDTKRTADEGRKAEVDRMNVFLNPVVEAESILKKKCKDYENDCAQKAEEERLLKEKEERERIQKAAQTAEDWGEQEKSEELKEEAKEVEVKAVKKVHKVSGLGIRRVWKVKIVDKSKLPIEYLDPNMPALNAKARELQKEFNIPGAEAYEE